MCRQVILCLSLLVIGACGQVLEQTKVVYTNQGAIRGYRAPNHDVFEFFNIPYATTPTGVNKFKAPLPPPSWNGTFDAVNRGIVCHQLSGDGFNVMPGTTMQEDCLVANVFVPDTQDINLPVLVNIHGGGYHVGFGAFASPNALVNSKKIIAVTFNYRIGVQGFLCLGTEVAPGNAGMKDQVALLRWVRDNIAEFGGNPEEVTIAGCSAGGSSADTLLLSNTTRGLFHKVIAESGCSISSLGIQFDPIQNAINHAVLLNFTDVNNVAALGDFYASLSLNQLTQHTWDYLHSKNSYFYFVPCVERDIGQERFLEEGPISILRRGDLPSHPILYGFATMEGILRLGQFPSWIQAMNTNFSDFLTIDLVFDNEEQRQQVANEVREFYFGTGALNTSHILSYIDYLGDVLFVHSIGRAISYHVSAGNNQIYLYEYSFTHNNSMTIPFTNVTGAAHCDQNMIAMGILFHQNPSEELLAMSQLMGEIYLNFITTGNPNSPSINSSVPFWPQAGHKGYPYLHIDSNITVVHEGHPVGESLANRTRFLDNVYEQYGTRIPIPPTISASPHSIISNKLWIVCAVVILFRL